MVPITAAEGIIAQDWMQKTTTRVALFPIPLLTVVGRVVLGVVPINFIEKGKIKESLRLCVVRTFLVVASSARNKATYFPRELKIKCP